MQRGTENNLVLENFSDLYILNLSHVVQDSEGTGELKLLWVTPRPTFGQRPRTYSGVRRIFYYMLPITKELSGSSLNAALRSLCSQQAFISLLDVPSPIFMRVVLVQFKRIIC